MKTIKTPALMLTLALAFTSVATAAGENDNLSGMQPCINDDSFTSDIGGLNTSSAKLSQGLYDYFIARAKARKVKFDEMGSGECPDYQVSLYFGGSTGTPRAWIGSMDIYDYTSYFSPKSSDRYKQPVSVWNKEYYGVLEKNDGLLAFLLEQGKGIIDEFLDAYQSVN